jgi:hypothetical protein
MDRISLQVGSILLLMQRNPFEITQKVKAMRR